MNANLASRMAAAREQIEALERKIELFHREAAVATREASGDPERAVWLATLQVDVAGCEAGIVFARFLGVLEDSDFAGGGA